MHETEEQIRALFAHHLETHMSLADYLPVSIRIISEKMVQCLLQDGKILVCGIGASAANALHFSNAFIDNYGAERPALPAIVLSETLSSHSQEHHQRFARQIQALGNEKDLLLILTTNGKSHSLMHALDAAKDKDMDIVVLNGQSGGLVSNHLGPEDLEIRISLEHPARIREIHLFILHSLCELIESALFGAS
jgi:D-sedoheptulose 7-phosphate isomerase